MARGGISFDGIGVQSVTMKAASNVTNLVKDNGADSVVGLAVSITGEKEAGIGSLGAPVFGRIRKYEEDGNMTVQYRGFAEFNGVSASLPTVGTDFFVVADGDGGVAVSAGAGAGAKPVVSVGEKATGPVVVLLG